MKRSAVLIMVVLLTAGIAYAKDYEVNKKAGEYDLVVKIDKNPPVAGGDNNMTIRVKDKSGKYVSDAKVKVTYSMPAMPGMPAMNYKADAELKGDDYTAKINFPMSGSWNVAVKVIKGGKTSAMKFTVDAK